MASRCLNRVMIIGNLGGEPRLASTKGGTPVCSFTVATNRSWTPSGSTEKREETQWHTIVTFGKLAEICGQILTKGTKVFVSGRIQTREFTNTEGQLIKNKEIVALQVIGLDKRRQMGGGVANGAVLQKG